MFNRADFSMNEAIRFDEIYHECDVEIKRIDDETERYVKQWPPCVFID